MTGGQPACSVCGGRAVLHPRSDHVFARDHGPVWCCTGCPARVGCHPGTTRPLGTLSDASLRAARMAAHGAFDPLWTGKMRRDGCTKGVARRAGYAWLAGRLGIDAGGCHIGLFDADTCARVVEVCAAVGRRRHAVSQVQDAGTGSTLAATNPDSETADADLVPRVP